MIGGVLSGALWASLLGGLLCVDRTAAFQTMVSRPIVAGPLTGFLLGAPEAGLVAGGLIELLFIGDLPVGRYVPVNDTALTVGAVAVVSHTLAASGAPSGLAGSFAIVPLSLLALLPLSRLYDMAEGLVRRRNRLLYDRASERVASGDFSAPIRENLKGTAFFFLANAIAIFMTILPFMLAAPYAAFIVHAGWAAYLSFAVCAAIGAASALNALRTRRSVSVFMVAALGAVVMLAL